MTTYYEYELEDGTKLYIEGEGPTNGVAPVARGRDVIKEADTRLEEALVGVKRWALALSEALHDLEPNETEVKFGVKAFGEAGAFAVGKLGAEANYVVTLKWKRDQNA